MLVTQKGDWTIRLPARPTGAKWTEDPHIVTWLDYRQDGQGFTDEGYRHIFVVPAGGGTREPEGLTPGRVAVIELQNNKSQALSLRHSGP